jgi:hypothetical protein
MPYNPASSSALHTILRHHLLIDGLVTVTQQEATTMERWLRNAHHRDRGIGLMFIVQHLILCQHSCCRIIVYP